MMRAACRHSEWSGARSFVLAAAWAVIGTDSAAAQQETLREAKPFAEVTVLGANLAIGAITAGVGRKMRGGSFWRAASYGAAGGAAVYLGKRIVGSNQPGAGWLGREIAAVGSSAVKNASDGLPPLKRLMLPAGPVRLYVTTGGKTGIAAKLDIAAVIFTIDELSRSNTRFDAAESFSSGAIVFAVDADSGTTIGGSQRAGVLEVANLRSLITLRPDFQENQVGHEMIHAIQYDFSFLVWSSPAEEALMKRIPGGKSVNRYLDLGLNVPLWLALNGAIRYDRRPWEREAVTIVRKN